MFFTNHFLCDINFCTQVNEKFDLCSTLFLLFNNVMCKQGTSKDRLVTCETATGCVSLAQGSILCRIFKCILWYIGESFPLTRYQTELNYVSTEMYTPLYIGWVKHFFRLASGFVHFKSYLSPRTHTLQPGAERAQPFDYVTWPCFFVSWKPVNQHSGQEGYICIPHQGDWH